MGMKAAGAKLVLEGGLLNKNTHAGWMTSNTNEVSPSGSHAYARVQVPRWRSSSQGGWRESSTGNYVNRDAISFPTPGANWGTVTHIGLWDASTSGNLLLSIPLDSSLTINQSAVNGVDAGDIGVQNGTGEITAAGMSEALVNGLFDGTRYLAMHTGAPTTGNQIGNYIAVAEAAVSPVSGKDNEITNPDDIDFGTYRSNLARPTHIGLWTTNSGGVLLASTSISAADPRAGAGITLPANRMVISITVD